MSTQPPDNDQTELGDVTVPIVEEVAALSKRERVTGRVRVSTTVDEVEEVVRAALRTDAVEVTRVPVDRPVDSVPAVRTEGDVTIVPIFEEVLVVEKRLVLKEELHIRRTTTTETVEEPVRLRRQRAVVERFEGDDAGPAD
jgi:stress response protein YsnF